MDKKMGMACKLVHYRGFTFASVWGRTHVEHFPVSCFQTISGEIEIHYEHHDDVGILSGFEPLQEDPGFRKTVNHES